MIQATSDILSIMFSYIWPILLIVTANTVYQICAIGIVITGLEVGFICAYKAGWKVNTLALVANTLLAAVLIFVGFFLYKEQLSVSKIVGIVICLAGLYFINK